jgi:hypothetical protein
MFTSHGIIIMYPTPVTHIPIDRNTYLHQHAYQSRYYHVPHYSDTTCHCSGAHDDNTVTAKHADVDMYYGL